MKKNALIILFVVLCTMLSACGKTDTKAPAADATVTDPADTSAETADSTDSTKESAVETALYPSSEDELTKSANFPNDQSVTVKYPELMDAMVTEEMENFILFYPTNLDQCDDKYINVTLALHDISGIEYLDDALSKGSNYAEGVMKVLAEEIIDERFTQDIIGNPVLCNFTDNGNYYGMSCYILADGSQFEPASEEPLAFTFDVRYCGPTGYALVTTTMCKTENIDNYYKIGQNITDSISLLGNWSTAPKVAPSAANTPKKGIKAPAKASKRKKTEEHGNDDDMFYWTDEDGDIWLWNGFENEFIAYGKDYYVDDDGQIYESNDAGWDTADEYDGYDFDFEGSEVNDYDYYDGDIDSFSDYDSADYSYDDSSYDDYSYDDGGYDDYSYDDGGYDDYGGDDW